MHGEIVLREKNKLDQDLYQTENKASLWKDELGVKE